MSARFEDLPDRPFSQNSPNRRAHGEGADDAPDLTIEDLEAIQEYFIKEALHAVRHRRWGRRRQNVRTTFFRVSTRKVKAGGK